MEIKIVFHPNTDIGDQVVALVSAVQVPEFIVYRQTQNGLIMIRLEFKYLSLRRWSRINERLAKVKGLEAVELLGDS